MRAYLACYYRYAEMPREALAVVPDLGRREDFDNLPATAYPPIVRVSAPNRWEARRAAPYLIHMIGG